mmetsp:Transcript_65474/g.107685  ORF Transcript_65474/g.107685 Transcript_65474/m.107685 type:complete len:189 (-) Transcript_65474:86-652(-)
MQTRISWTVLVGLNSCTTDKSLSDSKRRLLRCALHNGKCNISSSDKPSCSAIGTTGAGLGSVGANPKGAGAGAAGAAGAGAAGAACAGCGADAADPCAAGAGVADGAAAGAAGAGVLGWVVVASTGTKAFCSQSGSWKPFEGFPEVVAAPCLKPPFAIHAASASENPGKDCASPNLQSWQAKTRERSL